MALSVGLGRRQRRSVTTTRPSGSIARDIVIGVGSSTASDHVLRRAMAEGASTHRTVRAIHTWSTPAWGAGPTADGWTRMPSAQEQDRWAKDVADQALAQGRRTHAGAGVGEVTATAEGSEGFAGDVLVRAAAESGLLVVGGRSHGGLGSALLGSSTGYALHHAGCPVMVVPTTAADGPFRRVVVGFDDSPCSRSALRWALNAARRHRCPLVVVHALRLTRLAGQMPVAELYPAYAEELHVWLDGEVAEIRSSPGDVAVSTQVRDGSAAEVLLAETGTDDLLVLGSRGRGGFRSLLLGSVATQCAQHSRGALVVVRAGTERLDDKQLTAAATA